MQISILGSLRVADGDRAIRLSGARQKAVVAYLALRHHDNVPAERLVTDVWGEDSSAEAVNALQAVVSRLRRILPDGTLITAGGSYALHLDSRDFDAERFEQAFADGRVALARGAAWDARRTLQEALELWRGPVLADFRFEPFAQRDIARLEELHLTCQEGRIDADLALGDHDRVIPELRQLIVDHPLREGPRGQLMRALRRSGHRDEALAAFREARDQLMSELGIEPSPYLLDLEAAIRRGEPIETSTRDMLEVARAPARRLITVLWLDATAQVPTADEVDLETWQTVRSELQAILGDALGRFGGHLVTGGGRQLLGIFGMKSMHEDDAHRAALTAEEISRLLRSESHGAAWQRVNLRWRMGLATAEALVAGTHPIDVVSEAATSARRLAETAEPGDILMSEPTYRLAAAALEATPTPRGHRLTNARFGVRSLPVNLDTELVGRAEELRRLDQALEAVERTGSTRVVTVLGEAGVGKTRLLHEHRSSVGDRARVVTGRCLAYGEAITFWPLREIILQVTGGTPSTAAISGLLPPGGDNADVTARLSQITGVGESAGTNATEVLWAIRHLLESLARTRPLLVMLDDLHWADPTFLDLLESINLQPLPAPVLVVCLARPDLLERRPKWATTCPDVIRLEPLDPAEALSLLDALMPPGRRSLSAQSDGDRARLLGAAGGNPLYMEQLVAWLGQEPAGAESPLPLTIQALLAARLDRLGPAEQEVLSCASVLGKDFATDAAAALLPEEARRSLDRHLTSLADAGLIARRPDRGRRETAHSFRHILIQQAAYRTIPKARRAELHEQVATGMATATDDRDLQETEILAHHLEQATLCRRDLQQHTEATALARRAAKYLDAAGASAISLGNALIAVNHYERAARLLTADSTARAGILTSLGTAQWEAGRLSEAANSLGAAGALATAMGDDRLRARAEIQAIAVGLNVDPDQAITTMEPRLPELAATFTHDADDAGLSQVWDLRARMHWLRARSAAAELDWQQAAVHARRTGDRRQLAWILAWLASGTVWGPTPARQGIARCLGYLDEEAITPTTRASILLHLAGLYAMRDDLATAHDRLASGARILEELSANLPMAIMESAALVAFLQGNPAAAERHLRPAYEQLTEMGERDQLATTAAFLARALALQGPDRHDEAETIVGVSDEAAATQDLSAKMVSLGVRARILAGRGLAGASIELAREAVIVAERTDFLNQHGDALLDLADVLQLAGKSADSRVAVRQAIELYTRKENLPASRSCRKRLASEPLR
jgi:DNA-binding SARP family transcriptional activator/DNA-binding transcriptional ArsR family regulator